VPRGFGQRGLDRAFFFRAGSDECPATLAHRRELTCAQRPKTFAPQSCAKPKRVEPPQPKGSRHFRRGIPHSRQARAHRRTERGGDAEGGVPFPCRHTTARKAGGFHAFDAAHDLGHRAEFRWRSIDKPEAPAIFPVDEFVGRENEAQEFFSARFGLEQLRILLRREQQESAIVWHTSKSNLRRRGEWRVPFGGHHVVPLDEIRRDVADDGDGGIHRVGVVVTEALLRDEADDDDVDVGLAARLALSREGAVGEVGLHAVAREEVAPEDAGLLALADGIRGDEGDVYVSGSAGALARSLRRPAGDIGRG